jgi:Uma2 family endonuclease
MDAFILETPETWKLSDEALFDFCVRNEKVRIERLASGELVIQEPAGSNTGLRNAKITIRLGIWAENEGTGLCFDSSAGFILPDSSMFAPDASWIRKDRWEKLTEAEQNRFAPLCPDFVVELRSPSDRMDPLHKKMGSWITNGCRLGWLIDPVEKEAFIYRPDHEPERHAWDDPLSGGDVLPGFVLNLSILE